MSGNRQKYANWPEDFGDPEWFLHDRFGLFIHFGLYSSAARHEWVMTYEKIHPDTYKKYFDHFNPDLLDAKEWAYLAKVAGMKYVIITTKHHEGFALWDTAQSDYKVTNTPIQKDILAETVGAFREAGLKIGFYHSLIDWNHPDFPLDGLHPLRDDTEARSKNAVRNMDRYVGFMHAQVRELLTQYGKIDYMWFDFSYPHRDWKWSKGKGKYAWQSEKLEQMVRQLQPDILLNDRMDLNRGVFTPEQYQPIQPPERDGLPVLWEACQTMNGSWGYHRDNQDWKPSEMLVKMLIDTVSKNGNFLLNIGPNARGEFDGRSIDRLEEIGAWMRLHSRSIYGATHSHYKTPVDCRYTQKDNRLYLHIFSWPFKHIHLDTLAGHVTYAHFLHDASEVTFKEYSPDNMTTNTETPIEKNTVVLELPVQKPDVIVPVIELFLGE
ncbi:MAG TPA: alpha-L-fucosidase [Bacillota bacterium]|nr:alpha-L-fucosidase [Bacillota bacterium]